MQGLFRDIGLGCPVDSGSDAVANYFKKTQQWQIQLRP
jgi:hypothetical protein